MHPEIIRAAKKNYPINSIKNIYKRFKFYKKAKQKKDRLDKFIERINALGYSCIFDGEIHVLGTLEWPYINLLWDVEQRFDVITRHYELVKTQPKFLDVTNGQPLKILDLNSYSLGARIVLDKASWFVREGEIVLNFFINEHRIYSVGFTLGMLDNELVIYVGAIQGLAPQANIHSMYILKKLTKDFEGLRPRSLLVEILRMLASMMKVKRILAVSDHNRHHHHPYFDGHLESYLTASYDAIWEEHGGIQRQDGFFELPVKSTRRSLTEVASNKRSMYRKRYAILDEIERGLSKYF